MSWESELGNSVKHGRWPNPFKNLTKEINVLACEGTWQAMFSMYAIGFGNWFWSTFIPGPWEITRKTFTGSYKCGFYSRIRVKSPLDVIWRDGSAARTLGQIIRPATTAAFYLWGMQTAWDALQTWSSILYAMEMCDWDGNTTTLANAIAPIQTNPTSGGVAFAEVIYDPRDRAVPNDCIVRVEGEVVWQAHAIGYIVADTEPIHNVRVGMTVNNETYILATLGDVGPFQTAPFAVSMNGVDPFLDAQPYFYAEPETFGPAFGVCHVTRFIVNAFPPSFPWEPGSNLQDYSPPVDPLCNYYE